MRKRLFVADAMSHPAKGHIAMWQECIDLYSKPGDTILDPLAGIGTSLIAALMGRSVICLELEEHFCVPMRRSWEKMRTMPMLGYTMGQAVILRGDARCLPLPDASVGAAITSPPYEGSDIATLPTAGGGIGKHAEIPYQDWLNRQHGYTRMPVDASAKEQCACGMGQVDTILTSPPYEGTETSGGDQLRHINRKEPPRNRGYVEPGGAERQNVGYTRKPVDAIVTSPPFAENVSIHKQQQGLVARGYFKTRKGKPASGFLGKMALLESTENIGNMKGSQYFDAMKLCYAECWRVLKPGGLLCLVVKGFTRASAYVDLPGQTEALLLEAGWQKHDHWRRELWSLSFWRILQKRRDPEAFDDRLKFEEVLAFRKPEGGG